VIWAIDVALVVITLGLLVLTTLVAWRKARRILRSAAELRSRVETLANQASELGDRLDTVEVNARLTDARTG
jgi:uncharacterized protein HemY